MTFSWNENCTSAFEILRHCFTCTCLSPDATEFVLQTDASAVGLGAVLEQNGHPLHMLANLSPAQSVFTSLFNIKAWPLSLP